MFKKIFVRWKKKKRGFHSELHRVVCFETEFVWCSRHYLGVLRKGLSNDPHQGLSPWETPSSQWLGWSMGLSYKNGHVSSAVCFVCDVFYLYWMLALFLLLRFGCLFLVGCSLWLFLSSTVWHPVKLLIMSLV